MLCYLAKKVQDGGGQDGVHADEEVDADVGDEGNFCIFEYTC